MALNSFTLQQKKIPPIVKDKRKKTWIIGFVPREGVTSPINDVRVEYQTKKKHCD